MTSGNTCNDCHMVGCGCRRQCRWQLESAFLCLQVKRSACRGSTPKVGLQMLPSNLAFASGSVPLLHSQPSTINLEFLSNFYFPHLLGTNEG
ncbi:hypothetical protein ACRRTK_000213 [Alexandromys fortis]